MNHSPRSKHYRQKADAELTRIFSAKPCLICGKIEGVCGHHMVDRNHGYLRHNLNNVMPLCPEHHTQSDTLAAHSTNARAQTNFLLYLMENHAEVYQWYQQYKFETGMIDYERAYNELKGVK